MPFGRRRDRIDRSLREKGVPPEPQLRRREVEETCGPYDETDAPDDGVNRIDLGSLRLRRLDRVAQLVVQRVEQVVWREVQGELPGSARGTGGHGSTGGFATAAGKG